jgi:hypothetical protein
MTRFQAVGRLFLQRGNVALQGRCRLANATKEVVEAPASKRPRTGRKFQARPETIGRNGLPEFPHTRE